VPNCRNERPKVWTNVPKCRGRTFQSADIAKDIVPEIHQPGVVSGVGSCVHSYEVNRGGERGGSSLPASIRGCRSYGYEVNRLIGKGISDLTAPLATY